MQERKLPDYLASTFQMLKCAFPNGIPTAWYYSVLSILYSEMSDRNLAVVMSYLTEKTYEEILNDVYRIGASAVEIDDEILRAAQKTLDGCGFANWVTGD
jgi:hypothetical protein